MPLHLPTGVFLHEGTPTLVVPGVDYDGLTDAMFHMLRQNGASSATVLIRLLDVLTAVVSCEHDPSRRATLQRHADLVLGDAKRNISTPEDLEDIIRRHCAFKAMKNSGPLGHLKSLSQGRETDTAVSSVVAAPAR